MATEQNADIESMREEVKMILGNSDNECEKITK